MKKIIASVFLFAIAGVVAFFVKDALDMKHPEYAIPEMTVTADSKEIASTVAGFSWKFAMGQIAEKQAPPVFELETIPVSLLGGELLEFKFSQPAKKVIINQSKSYSYDFEQTNGKITVPFEKGAYLYEVNAEFEKGTVSYFVYITVE